MAVSLPTARTSDDIAKLRWLNEVVFHSPTSDASWELRQQLYQDTSGLVVHDGDDVVGHAGFFRFQMTVPGGRTPAHGITEVVVLPTHRRRGILTSLMRRQLDDLHAEGAMVAPLWASESAIYGRFGYGQASRLARSTVPRSYQSLRTVPDVENVRLEVREMTAAQDVCRGVYERAVPLRPGMIERSKTLHAWVTRDEYGGPGLASRVRTLLAFDAATGSPRGYAWFNVKSEWHSRGPEGTTSVREFIALDPAANAALLRSLLDIDLTSETRFTSLPVDHEIFGLLVEPRRAAPVVLDQLWVRLVDVGAALTARTYATDVTARIAVRDEFCLWNDGVWLLDGGPTGAKCEKDSGNPDVVLDVRDLATIYLGDGSLGAMVRAGLVEERVPGTVGRLMRAFAHDPLPWCSFIF
jgi:predicted acetyltransferase